MTETEDLPIRKALPSHPVGMGKLCPDGVRFALKPLKQPVSAHITCYYTAERMFWVGNGLNRATGSTAKRKQDQTPAGAAAPKASAFLNEKRKKTGNLYAGAVKILDKVLHKAPKTRKTRQIL